MFSSVDSSQLTGVFTSLVNFESKGKPLAFELVTTISINHSTNFYFLIYTSLCDWPSDSLC